MPQVGMDGTAGAKGGTALAVGLPPLRPAPAGLPEPDLFPPVVAETGDPFAALRVVCLLARLPRGVRLRIEDIADRLNALYLDWYFSPAVVADVLVALRANWAADFRSETGILLEDGPYGPSAIIEDRPQMDPWLVGQARGIRSRCLEALHEFARRDRPTGDG
jgi:hypothetical protein